MNRAAESHFRGPETNGRRPVTAFLTLNRIAIDISCFLVAAFLLFVASRESWGQVPETGSASTATRAYVSERIHYGDVVDVDFVGSLEFDWRGGLTSEGFLDGLERAQNPVFALCRTEAEVAAAITEQHRYFLRDPQVVVRIIDRSKRPLTYVSGAVRVPQRFQLRRPVSLQELIVLSGGITDSSNGEIVIFRPPNASCAGTGSSGDGKPAFAAGSQPKRMSVRIADLLSGKAHANQQVMTGDIVNVIEAPPVFVIGDVTTPRRMNLTPDLTLTRAIAYAGGVSRSFSGQKARVHRRNPEPKVFELDLRVIIEKKAVDLKLEPYDVVEVEQKGFAPQKVVPVDEPRPLDSEALAKLPLRIVD